jgi:gas vesicle protein
MHSESGTGFFPGLILGAVVGAAVALLYAPQPGAETRRMVKEKALEIKDKAANSVCGISESAGFISKRGDLERVIQ